MMMKNFVGVLVTSLFVAGIHAAFRPCLVQYSNGYENVTDCYPPNLFNCEKVNLTIPASSQNTQGNSSKPAAMADATIAGVYHCKPRSCDEDSSSNQTTVACNNASSTSQCVSAENSVQAADVESLAAKNCSNLNIPSFNLANDPDISYRCTIAPEVVLAQFACKVKDVSGNVLSQRNCIKGTKECLPSPSCRLTINQELVDLYFCKTP